MAQDRDGYLWLGLDTGLVRFDGIFFVNWAELSDAQLPSPSVKVLLAAGDGSLWAGFDTPVGIARITAGRVRIYSEADGIPKLAATAMVEGPDGSVWAGTTAGLFRFADNR
jgi:ligand-binding sensor domain-containing protein